MTDLEKLKAWREKILEARYSGTRSVQTSSGSRVEYRSDEEMRQALTDLERQIAAAEGRPPVSQVRIFGSKGL